MFCPDIKEIREANSMQNGLEMLANFKPDILFLDVELGDGTGIELLNKTNEVSFPVIFITAHNKYAVDAFRLSALDFLLKPIDPEELVRAVEKAKTSIKNQDLLSQLKVYKDSFHVSSPQEHKIVLKDSKSIYFVKVNDILFCEAETSYTIFHLTNSKDQIVISKKIKDFDEMLEQYGFIRVHQSFLVNKTKIKRFDKLEGGMLVLENDKTVPVSQRKKDYVLSLLSR